MFHLNSVTSFDSAIILFPNVVVLAAYFNADLPYFDVSSVEFVHFIAWLS